MVAKLGLMSMTIRGKLVLAAQASLLTLVLGCGTIASHQNSSPVLLPGEPRFYRGVTYDGMLMSELEPFGLFIMLDVPFSFVADTVMLPFDAKSHYVDEHP
jgi:uncharacterized protein YceK